MLDREVKVNNAIDKHRRGRSNVYLAKRKSKNWIFARRKLDTIQWAVENLDPILSWLS